MITTSEPGYTKWYGSGDTQEVTTTPTTKTTTTLGYNCEPGSALCVTCLSTKIIGVVLRTAISVESLMATDELDQTNELLSIATLNGVAPSSDCNFVYDAQIDGFRFEATLGQCGMTGESIAYQDDG